MEMQELEITISQKGTVNISVKGVTGNRCIAITEGLERAVGNLTGREYTSEYYEQDSLTEHHQHDFQKS